MSTQTQVGRLWVQNTTVDDLDERELINDFTVTFNGTPVDNNNFVKLDKNTVLYTGPTIASSTVVLTKVSGFTNVAVNQYYQRLVDAVKTLTIEDVASSVRLKALKNLSTAGLVLLPPDADTAPTVATATQVRSAAGLSRLSPTSTGVAVSNTTPIASPYTLSVQSASGSTWLEILNSYGVGGGSFLGMSGAGVAGDNFDIYSYQGGAARIFTGPTPGVSPNIFVFNAAGHTILPGLVAPKWYTPANLPSPSAPTAYGSMAVAFDAAAVPDTYPVVTNGARNAWLKVLTLTTAGLARVEELQIGTGATLTRMFRGTKTIAGTPGETITVTGAAIGDIVMLSKPVNGEVTSANTVTFNGTGLSGTLTAITMRFT
jgi:hypothetical protein